MTETLHHHRCPLCNRTWSHGQTQCAREELLLCHDCCDRVDNLMFQLNNLRRNFGGIPSLTIETVAVVVMLHKPLLNYRQHTEEGLREDCPLERQHTAATSIPPHQRDSTQRFLESASDHDVHEID